MGGMGRSQAVVAEKAHLFHTKGIEWLSTGARCHHDSMQVAIMDTALPVFPTSQLSKNGLRSGSLGCRLSKHLSPRRPEIRADLTGPGPELLARLLYQDCLT